jgi:hypothetical protein
LPQHRRSLGRRGPAAPIIPSAAGAPARQSSAAPHRRPCVVTAGTETRMPPGRRLRRSCSGWPHRVRRTRHARQWSLRRSRSPPRCSPGPRPATGAMPRHRLSGGARVRWHYSRPTERPRGHRPRSISHYSRRHPPRARRAGPTARPGLAWVLPCGVCCPATAVPGQSRPRALLQRRTHHRRDRPLSARRSTPPWRAACPLVPHVPAHPEMLRRAPRKGHTGRDPV